MSEITHETQNTAGTKAHGSGESKADMVKGFIQVIIVIAFAIVSVMVSRMLQSEHMPGGLSSSNTRDLYVDTIEASPQPHRVAFETTGLVQSRVEINITPQVSGRIIAVQDNFFEGGVFEAGEVLFEIEPDDYEAEVERLESEVAQARTNYNLEKAESEAALSEWKQMNGDKAPPSLVARKPQLAQSLAALNAAKASLENAQLNLKRTRYSLPFRGRVITSTIEDGQYVTAGQSYGSVFDMASLEMKASLEDEQLKWLLREDNPVISAKIRYLGEEKTYAAALSRSAGSLDTQTRFARVSFAFQESVDELLPGVFAYITVEGPMLDNVVQLPIEALQNDGMIWTVNPDDQTLSSMKPDIVYADGEQLILRNIKDTKRIVTSRLSGAAEGVKVILNKQAEETPKDTPEEEQVDTPEE